MNKMVYVLERYCREKNHRNQSRVVKEEFEVVASGGLHGMSFADHDPDAAALLLVQQYLEEHDYTPGTLHSTCYLPPQRRTDDVY
jgi:hypothetical protein